MHERHGSDITAERVYDERRLFQVSHTEDYVDSPSDIRTSSWASLHVRCSEEA